ncbi:hypothetical protein BGZ58_007164 [Dissophora ornata]|nr:hypothetical protein BGZ58_007164 [Dissophora ornata]
MPTIRSDTGAMPRGLHDDDPTVGMGFSILVTVCSLIGLLFCFRRASRLLPRNLNMQLQMFGQNNRNAQGRGPIALSEDDLAGATGIDWEDLEAQLQEDEEEGEERGQGEEMDDMTRPLKPMTRNVRYMDEEEEEGQELSSVSFRGRYRDDDEDDEDANEDEFHDFVESAGSKAPDSGGRPEESERKATQKDTPFSLEDADGEQEV